MNNQDVGIDAMLAALGGGGAPGPAFDQSLYATPEQTLQTELFGPAPNLDAGATAQPSPTSGTRPEPDAYSAQALSGLTADKLLEMELGLELMEMGPERTRRRNALQEAQNNLRFQAQKNAPAPQEAQRPSVLQGFRDLNSALNQGR